MLCCAQVGSSQAGQWSQVPTRAGAAMHQQCGNGRRSCHPLRSFLPLRQVVEAGSAYLPVVDGSPAAWHARKTLGTPKRRDTYLPTCCYLTFTLPALAHLPHLTLPCHLPFTYLPSPHLGPWLLPVLLPSGSSPCSFAIDRQVFVGRYGRHERGD